MDPDQEPEHLPGVPASSKDTSQLLLWGSLSHLIILHLLLASFFCLLLPTALRRESPESTLSAARLPTNSQAPSVVITMSDTHISKSKAFLAHPRMYIFRSLGLALSSLTTC